MAKKSVEEFELAPLGSLYSTEQERADTKLERIHNIPLVEIDEFPNHPYQVRDDEQMTNLVESIREDGVITPCIVRIKEDGRYELVSGHRRMHAAERAGLDALPSAIRKMTREEAIITMVDSNLQREEILPSEKAFSYKMKVEALSSQGKRTDLVTSAPLGQKSGFRVARDIVAEESGDSKSQIQRYIRLTELIPELLKLVDDKAIKIRPAVEISYLTQVEQLKLFDEIERQQCTPSHAQAIKLREFSENGNLSPEVIASIMMEEKPNQKEKISIRQDKISKYFKPGATHEEMEHRIIKGLELLERQERKRSDRSR